MVALHAQLRTVANFMRVGIQIKTTKLYQTLDKGLQALEKKDGQLFRRLFSDPQVMASVKIYDNYVARIPDVADALKSYKAIMGIVDQKDIDPMAQEGNLTKYIKAAMDSLVKSETEINKQQTQIFRRAAEDNPDLDRVKDKFMDLAKTIEKATDGYITQDEFFKWLNPDDQWWEKANLKGLMDNDFNKAEVGKKFKVLDAIVKKGKEAFQEWYKKNSSIEELLAAL